MAAYYGNIERYVRLRRPNKWVGSEMCCAVRGIYHNTMFAKWWSLQPGEVPFPIQEAIHARFIMNNDLSRITPDTKCLPYCIFYPSYPHVATCKELVRRVPSMKPAVARVCILRNYSEYWDELDADPDSNLMDDARQRSNPKYLRDLEARIPERGCRDFRGPPQYWTLPQTGMFEPTSDFVYENVANARSVYLEFGVPYNGRFASMTHVEVSVSVPDEVKKKAIEELEDDGGYDGGFSIVEYYNHLGRDRNSTVSTES